MADVGGAGKGLLEGVRFEVKIRTSLSDGERGRLHVGGSRYIAVFGRSGGHDDGNDDSTT